MTEDLGIDSRTSTAPERAPRFRIPAIDGDPGLYDFRPVGPVPVWSQAVAVCALFAATTWLTWREYRAHGTSFGYAGPAAFMLFVPIVEELIFRGFVLTQCVRRVRPWTAIAISSSIFGLYHLRNVFFRDLESVFGQMLFTGVVFGPIAGYVTLRFRTVWPAVVLHYANNLTFFLR